MGRPYSTKTDKTKKIRTSYGVEELAPEDISAMRRAAINNADRLSNVPGNEKLFVRVPVEDANGNVIPDKIELDKETTDEDVVRALLEYNHKAEAKKAELAAKLKGMNTDGYKTWHDKNPDKTEAKQPKQESKPTNKYGI